MNLQSHIPPSAKKVFSGQIYDIYQWQQKMFDGSIETFEAAQRENVVTIIPIIDDTILVQDEEQPNDVRRTGFPGGHIDTGEDPLTAAIRELHEETGMTFKNLKLVMVEDIGGPKLNWWAFRYVATDLVSREASHPGPGERIITRQVNFNELKELIESNLFMCYRLMRRIDSLDALKNLPVIELDTMNAAT